MTRLPRLWPEYHPAYYGAFVRDPDGNNVDAGVPHARINAPYRSIRATLWPVRAGAHDGAAARDREGTLQMDVVGEHGAAAQCGVVVVA
jgi:hypothetical protein